jgi:signal transduction histidine kinase
MTIAKTSRFNLLIAAACALLLTLLWAGVSRRLSVDRAETIATAVQRNNNLAVSLEQYALRTIRNADALLQLTRLEYDRSGERLDLKGLLERGVIDPHYFSGVAVMDANGVLMQSNMTVFTDTLPNFSDRAHFQFHRTHKDSLFISEPLESRLLHKAVIVLSRRINKKDGSFGGTVAVQIEPKTFTQFYANANLRKYDIISLIAPTGITYARRTGNVESYGEDIKKSPLFQHLKKGPVGNYFARDAIRNIPTYFSFRRLAEYPVIATVGASEDDVLAAYYPLAWRARGFASVLSALLLLFSFLLAFTMKQRQRNAEQAQVAEQQLFAAQQRYQQRLTQQIIDAQERERESIGRELHDNVNQVLTSVKLYLDLASADPAQAPGYLAKATPHLQSCINEIRHLSRELSAPTLGTHSLIDSIKALIELVAGSSGLHILFFYDKYTATLDKEQKLAFYRILQEQLSNIVRHANANEVRVNLGQANDFTELVVRDNGQGFDVAAKRGGIGLNNIESRARVFGGKVKLVSKVGEGTLLAVRIPCPPASPLSPPASAP